MSDNHASLYRFRHARFHVFIYFFDGHIACPDFSSGESRILDNHPSVCHSPHARFLSFFASELQR